MKKLIALFIVLVCFSSLGLAQNSDQNDLRDIASRVVLIGIVEDGEIVGNGSGTIVDPSGIIFTNRHVVEDAEDLAIFMLTDIAELPELRYFASVSQVSSQIDFAIIQIDRDADGNPIDPATLNLPAIAFNVASADIGDEVRVFGYPGIGEGYMVVTSGEISTIQNGTVDGQRVPVWYSTDTEISGGNSGGLAVNSSGQLVGIPTSVITEDRTAGKLGGILPFSTVLALIDGAANLAGSTDAPLDTPQTSSEEFTLTLANTSEQEICYVFISSTSATEWGEDQLGEQETIAPGSSRDWRIAAGFYDVLLRDCEGNDLSDTRNVDLSSDTSLTYSGGGSEEAPAPLTGGPVSVTCGEVEFTNGVEIRIEGIQAGQEYRVTALGMNGFDPVLAVFNDSDEGPCSDDNADAALYEANLPGIGVVAPSERNSQVVFMRDSSSDSGTYSLVVGGYDNQVGEFVLIVEGPSMTAEDGLGDIYAVNLASGIAESPVPLSVYMIRMIEELDPALYAIDSQGSLVIDARGEAIYCDDSGNAELCWGNPGDLTGSSVSLFGGGALPGAGFDAEIIIPTDLLRKFASQQNELIFLASSYQQESFGAYVMVFHMAIGG